MNKVQMEQDFKQLSMGKNPALQMQNYYKKKRKEMFLLLVMCLVVFICAAVSDYQNSIIENNYLFRKENGGGKKEVSLEVKVNDEVWQEVPFVLEEKSYTKEELEKLEQQAMEELPKVIAGENDSLNEVSADLDLVAYLENYPFLLKWESTDTDLMDDGGSISFDRITKKEQIGLEVSFCYGEWEKTESLKVTIYPEEQEDKISLLQEALKQSEEETRENKIYQLPDSFQNQTLQWRYEKSNSALILGIIFIFMIPFISYQKDEEIHKRAKRRKQQLLYTFPEFISKLILFMEAGMSIKNAFFRMAQEYQKKKGMKKEEVYLYEEVWFVCKQMKNGLSEKEAYELLAQRCGLPCYRKLSSLLIQHLQKGSVAILENLRKESIKANEEQKAQIQKKGEEISTKLLLPMMIMLGIVMVFIMVPALFSFQM